MRNRGRLDKLLNSTAGLLTEEEIFTSGVINRFLYEKNLAVHKAWHIPDVGVTLLYDYKAPPAFTEGRSYYINTGSEFFDSNSREEKFLLICGADFHEVGHRLFTSFISLQNYMNSLKCNSFWPKVPEVARLQEKTLDEIMKFMNDGKGEILIPILKTLVNILEDGRIEYLLLNYCRNNLRLTDGLQFLRTREFQRMKSLNEIISETKDTDNYLTLDALCQIILHYARFGEVKGLNDSNRNHEIIKKLETVIPYIDDAVESRKTVDFYNDINMITVLLWEDIKEYIEKANEKAKEVKSNSSCTEGENNQSDDSFGQISPTPADIKKSLEEIMGNKIEGMTEDNSNCNNSSSSPNSQGSDDPSIEKAISDLKNSSNEETSMLGYEKTSDITSSGNGKVTKDIYRTSDSGTKIFVDKLIKDIAEEKVNDNEEKALEKMLDSVRQGINFKEAHKNVSSTIYSVEYNACDIDEYKRISPSLIKIAKEMAKKSKDLFADNTNVCVKNKYYGNKFNTADVAKGDYKFFSRNVILEEIPDVAIGLICDESGSMSGPRITHTKAAALTLFEYAHLMNMPIAIYGHTAHGGHADIFVYADYDKPDYNDRYRIMKMQFRNCNRDGYAIRMMVDRMKELDAGTKILFIISDGQPNDDGYRGTAAEADLQDIVKMCNKENITIVAAAIGTDKPQIKRIYGSSSFLDISNLEKLPLKLVNIIKQNL